MAEAQTDNNGKKKKAFMIVGIVVALGLTGGYVYSAYLKTHITTDDAFIEGNIHTISARIGGTVMAVHVKDNQAVKQGDLLLELDPADNETRHREASSALGVEKARMMEADARIEAAKATLELQRANLKLAQTEKTRAENLFQQEVLSHDRLDRAISAHEVALAQVKAAEEQLRQAESQKFTQASLVRQKEASTTLAGLHQQYTKVYAPAEGYITRKSVQPGNQIQPGQPLMALVSLIDLWVIANYKETELGSIRPGQQATIKIDSYPGRTFKGTVDSIMAGTGVSFSLFPAENATGNYVKVVQRIPVKIKLQNDPDLNHVLRIGMSVVPTVLAK